MVQKEVIDSLCGEGGKWQRISVVQRIEANLEVKLLVEAEDIS